MACRPASAGRVFDCAQRLACAAAVLVLTIGLAGNSALLGAGGLHDAIRAQDAAAVAAMIASGADLNQSDYQIGTPLHVAVSGGFVKVAANLISHGADIEAPGEINGMRPLHMAAQSGDVLMAKLLLDRGAGVEAYDGLQRTPLLVAASAGHVQLARLLIGAGAAVDGREGIRSRTPLMMACYFGRIEMVELLLERGADVNATDSFNDTSLSFAVGDASYRNARGPALIEYLLANGADPSIRRNDGLTALGYARVRGFKEQSGVLRRLGVTE